MEPPVSIGQSEKAMLAEAVISLTAIPKVSGNPWPPKSTGMARPFQPASQKAL